MKELTLTDDLTKEDVTFLIIRAKKAAGLTWEGIAGKIGMSPVWTHSACMDMNAFTPAKAHALATLLELRHDCIEVMVESPTKVWAQTVPTDPCIYRLYEIVGVYGPTIKALLHETFGDGVMSAIDFDMTGEPVANPTGDRVKIEMSGKYLGYNAW